MLGPTTCCAEKQDRHLVAWLVENLHDKRAVACRCAFVVQKQHQQNPVAVAPWPERSRSNTPLPTAAQRACGAQHPPRSTPAPVCAAQQGMDHCKAFMLRPARQRTAMLCLTGFLDPIVQTPARSWAVTKWLPASHAQTPARELQVGAVDDRHACRSAEHYPVDIVYNDGRGRAFRAWFCVCA